MGRCMLCTDDAEVPDEDLLGHLRVLHPDAYGDGPARWPDGGLVLIDTTAETPADISAPVAPCPDCVAGKCSICAGLAWDDVADAPTECPCAVRGHQPKEAP